MTSVASSLSFVFQNTYISNTTAMQFQLQVKPIQLAVVASHGITDFDIPYFWLEYASCLLTPVPDVVITVLFLGASVLHFAEDFQSNKLSVIFHALLAIIGYRFGLQDAFDAVFKYLCFFHVPLHYRRCAIKGRFKALWLAAASTMLGCVYTVSSSITTLHLSSTLQRIVLSHILCERRVNIF